MISPQHSILQIIQWICLFFSLLVNTCLLVVIHHQSPKNIGNYKYLMMSFSLTCLMFSTVSAIGQPTILVHGDCVILLSALEKDAMPRVLSLTLIVTYATTCMVAMCLISIQFIFRFFAVCKPSNLHYFSEKRLLAWYFGIFLVILDLLFLCFWVIRKRVEISEYMRVTVAESLDVDIDKLEYIGVKFFDTDENGGKSWNVNAIFLEVNIFAMLVLNSTVSVFCGFRTYQKTSTLILDTTCDSFNKQIFLALIAQTSIPIIFLTLPISIIIFSPLLNVQIDWLYSICTVSMSIYPILDPLAVMMIVSAYRKSLIPMLKPRKWKQIVKSKLMTVNHISSIGGHNMDIL